VFTFIAQETFQLWSAMHSAVTLLLLLSKTGCCGTAKFHPDRNQQEQAAFRKDNFILK